MVTRAFHVFLRHNEDSVCNHAPLREGWRMGNGGITDIPRFDGPPPRFHDLVYLAIRVDQHLTQCCDQRLRCSLPSRAADLHPQRAPFTRLFDSHPDTEPMQVGRLPVSHKKMQQPLAADRATSLLYAHFKRQHSSVVRGLLASVTPLDKAPGHHTLLPARLQNGTDSHVISALVDFGAKGISLTQTWLPNGGYPGSDWMSPPLPTRLVACPVSHHPFHETSHLCQKAFVIVKLISTVLLCV
ncbi:uncharacterized protein LOC127427676 [Myxocyprinus asiaticus]|uniref:uncharacterized protein LOC127427676 n=1 Tax=Myxocyprinus asiaticus TaxID=70543 RepID=UPI002222662C|nr:uncharacterized protein LOC127427676 [Myxocyprinus asiaticus]XP_051531361.1 uncharacterized protein LOC127427676 [Myxocyprinus asiaticus]XP_051531362.1 uncharacterized protein LOC127427676 [Myxocyprinus asiaticus]XP_051531364.1 uncharacterized protein LOC127427676 [Myxocyprinus asiaticus]XP_051531365.1 uncharacterized protein LOC127427676 [Myxocyprinus asiaticus]XP_051531366.1 uncharacterized protein LOC127427676 [Myxocyprinus asiaticus]XP_051531367.1 uncharacterized protein LOC127427676 [